MSKYDPLWRHLQDNGSSSILLTFEDVKEVLGFPIDHSFLNYKKELEEYGYSVKKISLKDKTIIFIKK